MQCRLGFHLTFLNLNGKGVLSTASELLKNSTSNMQIPVKYCPSRLGRHLDYDECRGWVCRFVSVGSPWLWPPFSNIFALWP